MNREAWLTELSKELIPMIKSKAGLSINAGDFKIACGFPCHGARSRQNGPIGQCCHVPGRKTHEIFIHPKLDDGVRIADVALHELLHVAVGVKAGHRKPFSRAAKAVGLEGKPTATEAGDDLRKALEAIVAKIGKYPHEGLDMSGQPKQQTRLLKVMCPICGYVARVTAKWIDEAGSPKCPQCDVHMEEAEAGEGARSPLVAVDQTVEYKVKAVTKPLTDNVKLSKYLAKKAPTYDPRWSIRMNRVGRDMRWWVVDYGEHVLGVELPRLTPAESREDALSILEALRDGLMTYDDPSLQESDENVEDVDDDYLNDDEDEAPDYEDGYVSPEEEEAYEAEQRQREAWVETEAE